MTGEAKTEMRYSYTITAITPAARGWRAEFAQASCEIACWALLRVKRAEVDISTGKGFLVDEHTASEIAGMIARGGRLVPVKRWEPGFRGYVGPMRKDPIGGFAPCPNRPNPQVEDGTEG
jgi:hypothetical protein